MDSRGTSSAGRTAVLGTLAGAWLAGWTAWAPAGAAAEAIPIPNGSFERPATAFVSLLLDSWQRLPKPEEYVETGGFLWSQLTGIFANSPAGSVDHLTNLDGSQALWVFAVPGAGVYQELDGKGGGSPAGFQAGRAYRLSARLLGAGGNMLDEAALTLSLYYRDAGSLPVPVASLVVTNRASLFPTRTQMVPCVLRSPVLAGGHPAVGRPIGIRVESTVTPALQGGYWDVDDLRLEAVEAPVPALAVTARDGRLEIRWPGEAGWRYQLRRSAALGGWEAAGEAVDGTGGDLAVSVPVGEVGHEFFVVTAVPAP
ncbi:MAG: hypothetical protein ACKOET_17305 [Verrucomicrobiota bacterium]